MKKKGSRSDFHKERRRELREAYLNQDSCMMTDEVMEKVVNTPATRFWVDPDNARDVISRVMKNPSLLGKMQAHKGRMYRELMKRYQRERSKNPEEAKISVISKVIFAGAPEFYMSTSHARKILNN